MLKTVIKSTLLLFLIQCVLLLAFCLWPIQIVYSRIGVVFVYIFNLYKPFDLLYTLLGNLLGTPLNIDLLRFLVPMFGAFVYSIVFGLIVGYCKTRGKRK
jgi:hypothetical protein